MARTPLLDRLQHLVRELRACSAAGLPARALPDLRAARAPFDPERRRLLAAGAAAAAVLAAPRPLRAGAADPRIAIVGAGIAGLSAALYLRDRGIDAKLYEASARTGGRIFSNFGGVFDQGQTAEWCGELIDTGHKRMRLLAKRFDLKLKNLHAAEPDGSEDTNFLLGSYYTRAQAETDFAAVLPALTADVDGAGYPTTYESSTLAGQTLDALSVYDWIESRVPGGHASPLGALLDLAYATEYGADTADQSALNLIYLLGFQPEPSGFSVFGESDEKFHVAGGNQLIPKAIASHLGPGAIRKQHRLVAIVEQANGAIRLSFDTPGGAADEVADLVLLTVPFAVLRESVDLTAAGFSALKLQAIDELGRGTNGKLQLQFTARHWAGTGAWPGIGNGNSYSDSGYQSSWEVTRAQKGTAGILNAFTGAAVTRALLASEAFTTVADAGAAADAATVLPQLDATFPGLAALWNGKLLSSLPHHSDLFRCSYSYYRVGQYTTFGGVEKKREGNVFFAGEHTSTDFQGFMEGGAREGRRAAKQIAKIVD